ncbi:TPA_asm: heme ABC transporter substrate-binding protein IsdE [Listeria monocytogenes]|uniref:heme ABC transporter substrate-binding protein IsdE n=1 Tax=Listeria monocytogenes TaxID=1639 RepID=UPI00074D62BE|nr:heme ABC transporter substrate-binding protein IsdE [Listeria monocytogenes]EDE2199719.1 heme ABC transporter substrate-binding protein IsdE [Listeria monocytogenes]OER16338.1 heme ABC transporter substrate-binding protein IsdE [Listeria monocytogenes]UIJ49930.1 heme ABC transporter substrate-binding protein IsdE [Listeria monocytogenes]CUL22812.1 High-affinity heme uptake system protein isdE [Listeria monocytogenes]CUL24506.1 High-affinity heme uptake system protein isdE [Listeria monocyto
MRKMAVISLVLLLFLVGCGKEEAAQKPEQKTEKEPKIVATTVAITEIMDKLDLPLVGIPSSSKKLPKRYADVKETGSPMGPDLEIIRMLKPDMVLSTKTLEADLKSGFEGANLEADFLDFTSIASMQTEIKNLGAKFDRIEEATKLNKDLTSDIDQVKSNVAKKKKPTVLILMGVPGSYLVVTEHAYIGDLVKFAGGENVIKDQKVEYLASNTEYLQSANPDIILRAAHGMPAEVVKMFDEEFKTNDIWKHFDAVKNNRVYDLDENLFGMTASLNAPEALKEMEKMLYDN